VALGEKAVKYRELLIIAIANGGTGGTTVATTQTNLGLATTENSDFTYYPGWMPYNQSSPVKIFKYRRLINITGLVTKTLSATNNNQ